jgi:hypothetical protein
LEMMSSYGDADMGPPGWGQPPELRSFM